MGHGDELGAIAPATFKYILAGPKGKKSWGQIYDQELKGGQKRIKKFAKENPWTAGIAGAAGMATSAIPTMGVGMGAAAVRTGAQTAGQYTTQALTRPFCGITRAVSGAKTAGAYGAVYGYGKGEGGVGERLASTVEPGAVGAAIGAATPIVGAIARPIVAHLSKLRAAKKAGIDPQAVDPIQEALESGAEGVARRVKKPLPDSIWADLNADTRGLLSKSVMRLGRFGYKARKEIGRRADEGGARVEQSLDDALGTPDGLETVVARMTAERKPILDKLYAQAEATLIRYDLPKGQRLLELIKSKQIPKGALTEAQKLLDAKKHESPALFKFDADGNVSDIVRVPDVKEARAIIDGMQQLIEGQRSDIPGKFKPLGAAWIQVQKEMKELLGDLVPAYREASALAEPTFVAKEAIELGQAAVGVNMSSAKFKAELAAMKKQHPRLVDMIDPHVRIGMRNNIQASGERAKTAMAASPTQAGHVGRFVADDPSTIRLIKDLSAKGLKKKISMVTGTKKAKKLFRNADNASESILTRESMEKKIRQQAEKQLDQIPDSPGVVENVMNLQFGSAGQIIKKRFSKPPANIPGPTEAAVANALMQPADREAMTGILRLRHKSERGLEGAKRAEMRVGGAGLTAAVGIQDDKTRAHGAADYLMEMLPERLTGLASAP